MVQQGSDKNPQDFAYVTNILCNFTQHPVFRLLYLSGLNMIKEILNKELKDSFWVLFKT